MNRIVVNLKTGTTTVVPLSQEEIAAAQAREAAWAAEQAAIVAAPSLEEVVAQLQAEIALLKGAAA